MKNKIIIASILALGSTSVLAAGLPCEELKARIVKKVEGKGVTNYQLTIVDKDFETKNRVVGTCEAGSKKIIYEKVKKSEVSTVTTD